MRNAGFSQDENAPAQSGSKRRFNLNRAQVVDENFIEFVKTITPDSVAVRDSARAEARGSGLVERHPDEPIVPGADLAVGDAIELFESQIISRHFDMAARQMRARNEGFYTIGSSGHEGNAVVGRVTRHTDVAFLHYRSGAFMAERSRKVPGIDFIRDTMLGFAAGRDDPTAGGRHKVWGSAKLFVPPQTSTVASHLPKAVGAALAIARAKKLQLPLPVPPDSIIVCSFGDATVNHAVAQTAFNAAALTHHQRLPVPILFVCEDNGLGISVETPPGWIEAQFSARCGLKYFRADGLDLADAHQVTRAAVQYCRSRRRPVFLHLKVVRLLGHAGSDPETEYHTFDQIETAEAKDPLLATARLLMATGAMQPAEILDLYEQIRQRVHQAAACAARTPKLTSAEEIMRPLAPFTPDAVAREAARSPDPEARMRIFGSESQLPERSLPRHMAVLINHGLHDLLIKYPEAVIFGEDVARKGGVYHVTAGLSTRFRAGRVFNSMLDETMILGMAIGAAHVGFLPIPEIQYLAYYHNAEDQVRGEACSLPFFSNGQFRNPMVIRIAGWAYQKGFGGHFHNDNSIATLRDVPGLIVCTPSRGDDAVKMMRTCMAMAWVDGRVSAFIEPIARYMTKDLYAPKDQLWTFPYPPPGEFIPFGEGAVYDCDGNPIPAEPRGSARAMSPLSRRPADPATGAEPPEDEGRAASAKRAAVSDRAAKRQGDETRAASAKPAGDRNDTADDLTILTFANGLYLSLRAARTLRDAHALRARVVDLRWLNPLNESFIVEQALATGRVLVVDEGRRTGGVGEAIMTILFEHCGSRVRATRLAGCDTYIPLGPAADHVLPGEPGIVQAAAALAASAASTTPPSPRTPARRRPRTPRRPPTSR